MNALHTIQEASLGGRQWFGGSVMDFDFGHTAATVFPPDRLSPRWLIVTTGGIDYWEDSFADVMTVLAIIAAN